MESVMSSDDSCDSEMKNMKSQLSAFGLDEENLSKEEMSDLLKALNNSKDSAKDEMLRHKAEEKVNATESPKKTMRRRYLNVKDRRMPWSLLPSTITQAEKARTLAVYIKLMSINNYRQARQSPSFMSWPPPLQIIEETTRVQPLRSTRSGRSVPIYAGFDDDSSDLDFVVTKTKKRKISNSEHTSTEGTSTNKTVSLKRKPSKDENTRPVKEPKLSSENNKLESNVSQNNVKSIFTLIED
ncbi:uncharacterized protein LOC126368589 [Pectinophora gossypiella]|uniref:Uncharacterized protein n=1 Tax=Pectinophora gossypiella TaxID=13191 RepID=A0A1E1WN75_PECGO|nr:uncharacterized protein LOC126368589 [Pectinophora gossypiella]